TLRENTYIQTTLVHRTPAHQATTSTSAETPDYAHPASAIPLGHQYTGDLVFTWRFSNLQFHWVGAGFRE
ncbi:hypothetical protein, partial [Streptomyces sp. NPDC004134]|uniref:hypothetical protein n=1 Tax=Streptomyces sp. NPDC004134 TaxID=3364691 RepID=UPI0036B17B67